MVRGITSQSTEGTQPVEGMQGQMSVIAITQEAFNDDHIMGRTKVSHGDLCALLKLIHPPPQDSSISLSV